MVEEFEVDGVKVKVGSEEEAAWTQILQTIKQNDEGARRQIEMNSVLIDFINQKLTSLHQSSSQK